MVGAELLKFFTKKHMSKALIVVDMQNDFVTGSLANPAAQEIVPKIKNLIESHEYEWIVFTQDTHYTNYLSTAEGRKLPIPHCISDSEGWNVVEELEKAALWDDDLGASYIWKPNFGSLQIAEHLEGLDQFDEVTFCGTCTDICVVSNALILKAMRPNLVINVKADCCAGTTLAKHTSALDVMASCQINII